LPVQRKFDLGDGRLRWLSVCPARYRSRFNNRWVGFGQSLSMSNDPSNPIVVLMTAANREEAVRIAETLVDARLAACVQMLPEIQSVYRWKGEVAREREVLLFAKTTRERFDELDRTVRELNSYETPEIIALPVVAASEPYLNWLTSELGKTK
jgi:periplasmic divalent cation tolerance protein